MRAALPAAGFFHSNPELLRAARVGLWNKGLASISWFPIERDTCAWGRNHRIPTVARVLVLGAEDYVVLAIRRGALAQNRHSRPSGVSAKLLTRTPPEGAEG